MKKFILASVSALGVLVLQRAATPPTTPPPESESAGTEQPAELRHPAADSTTTGRRRSSLLPRSRHCHRRGGPGRDGQGPLGFVSSDLPDDYLPVGRHNRAGRWRLRDGFESAPDTL